MPRTWRDTEDPRQALRDLLSFSSRDWAQVKGDAWLWGIVFGWDGEDDDGEGSAMDEVAARHGWDEHDVARLRRLHENFGLLELAAGPGTSDPSTKENNR